MAGSPRKRARRAGLEVPTEGTPARAPAPVRPCADPRDLAAYEKKRALLDYVLEVACDPVTNPDGAADELLRYFHAKALAKGDPVSAKLVLDVLESRAGPTLVPTRTRSASEMLEAVRAALPELEAKARAESEAAGTVPPETVAVDDGTW